MATSGGPEVKGGDGAPDATSAFRALGGWPGALGRIVAGGSLGAEEAAAVVGEVLTGAATPAQTAALLVALRMKGETVEEMTGLVRAMHRHAVPLSVEGDVVDVVGTGGDRLASINVSTLAACIAAGAGARVCKHGNRAASSSVGTADVLEALGVAVDLGPKGVARCVAEAKMGFCFAPRYHPAMRHAGPVRSQLGVPTVLNFLGPLANPAGARRQLVGVSDPAMAPKMAEVLGANGSVHAMVVYADDGLDELSVTSRSHVLEVVADPGAPRGFTLRSWTLEPEELGLARAPMSERRGVQRRGHPAGARGRARRSARHRGAQRGWRAGRRGARGGPGAGCRDGLGVPRRRLRARRPRGPRADLPGGGRDRARRARGAGRGHPPA